MDVTVKSGIGTPATRRPMRAHSVEHLLAIGAHAFRSAPRFSVRGRDGKASVSDALVGASDAEMATYATGFSANRFDAIRGDTLARLVLLRGK